jgi:hypothetical protein
MDKAMLGLAFGANIRFRRWHHKGNKPGPFRAIDNLVTGE